MRIYRVKGTQRLKILLTTSTDTAIRHLINLSKFSTILASEANVDLSALFHLVDY